ncbi:MAG: GNAT family N-acetyltransferase [Pseudomonadota bacterium]
MTDYRLEFLAPCRINEILHLYKLIVDEKDDELLISRFQNIFKTDYKILIAKDLKSEDVIGMVGLSYGLKVYCGKYIELHHMVILDRHRGKGIGRHMLKYINSYACLRDVDTIILSSYNHATDAHRLYEKNGYKLIGKHFLKVCGS